MELSQWQYPKAPEASEFDLEMLQAITPNGGH